ncbi:Nucleoside-diphosphate-sugar epimerase [Novosphingobium sp. CF614]|uniref:NAD-dependent epimerase/dehydratase family protein n=1 Tax=Novosphingobium sp. CF614 TaxID=1884364 RepID=UPI0008EE49E6|nr:NAD(P)-dependent oxidoreductase [Novosphingobium sp. CF614]SFG19862.1 Nucleoside-diphosphate-sugar epimerase [Novosphingobium sp. CF614]
MVRIAITGSSGFIGTNLVSRYKQQGADVLGLDIVPPRNPQNGDVHRQVDLLDRKALGDTLEAFDPDYLFHLGARTDLRGRSVGDYAANVEGVANLMAVVDRCEALRRVVVASSRLVCEIGYQPKSDTDYRPTTPYGESKIETEKLVRAAQTRKPWTIVRPTSIWGPWFATPYDMFFRLVGKGLFVLPRGRVIHKSFGFVGNTVHELDRIAHTQQPIDGNTFYLCDYPPLEVGEWTEMIRAAMDAPKVRSVPFGVLKLAAAAGDLMERLHMPAAPLTSFRLNNLVAEMTYDSSTVAAVAGELPFSLREGVEQTAAWIRGHERMRPA